MTFLNLFKSSLFVLITLTSLSSSSAVQQSKSSNQWAGDDDDDTEFWAAVAAEADKASLKSQSMSTLSAVSSSSAQKNDHNPKKRISDGTSIDSAKKAYIAKAVSSVSSTSNASTSTKGITRTQGAPSSDPLDSKRSTLSADVIQFKRIQGRNDHIYHLIDMIESAEESIEIFSKTLGWLPDDLFDSLQDAAHRGVGIKFTVQEVKNKGTHDTLVD